MATVETMHLACRRWKMLLYVLRMCDGNKTNESSIHYVVVCNKTM